MQESYKCIPRKKKKNRKKEKREEFLTNANVLNELHMYYTGNRRIASIRNSFASTVSLQEKAQSKRSINQPE